MKELPLNILCSRYPIVERAVADLRQFSDSSFLEDIRQTLQKVVDEDEENAAIEREKQGSY